MPPLTKTCPKMVLSHKGSLCVKDAFCKKILVPGEMPLAARSRFGHGSLRAMRRKSESIESSQRIDSAELVARRLSNFVDGPSNISRITARTGGRRNLKPTEPL